MANGRIKIDIELCKGCELCVSACPQLIIYMSDKINKLGVNYAEVNGKKNCTACKFCAIICPETAITVWREIKNTD